MGQGIMCTSLEAIHRNHAGDAIHLRADGLPDDQCSSLEQRSELVAEKLTPASRWLLPECLDHLGHGRAGVSRLMLF